MTVGKIKHGKSK